MVIPLYRNSINYETVELKKLLFSGVVFNQPEDFIVQGFFACFAEMNGYFICGGAYGLSKFDWMLFLFLLHRQLLSKMKVSVTYDSVLLAWNHSVGSPSRRPENSAYSRGHISGKVNCMSCDSGGLRKTAIPACASCSFSAWKSLLSPSRTDRWIFCSFPVSFSGKNGFISPIYEWDNIR
jgi:hypothetical protein